MRMRSTQSACSWGLLRTGDPELTYIFEHTALNQADLRTDASLAHQDLESRIRRAACCHRTFDDSLHVAHPPKRVLGPQPAPRARSSSPSRACGTRPYDG